MSAANDFFLQESAFVYKKMQVSAGKPIFSAVCCRGLRSMTGGLLLDEICIKKLKEPGKVTSEDHSLLDKCRLRPT